MARHDREDPHSLEDQLAWLDAIKEMPDEVDIAVSAVTSASLASAPATPAGPPAGSFTGPTGEPEVPSPYPQDPWRSVPSEPAPQGLLRTTPDHAYGAPVAVTSDGPAETEAEPATPPLSPSFPGTPPAELGRGPLFPDSPVDTDSFNVGSFGTSYKEHHTQPVRLPTGEHRLDDLRAEERDLGGPTQTSAEEPVRGWLEPAVPVETDGSSGTLGTQTAGGSSSADSSGFPSSGFPGPTFSAPAPSGDEGRPPFSGDLVGAVTERFAGPVPEEAPAKEQPDQPFGGSLREDLASAQSFDAFTREERPAPQPFGGVPAGDTPFGGSLREDLAPGNSSYEDAAPSVGTAPSSGVVSSSGAVSSLGSVSADAAPPREEPRQADTSPESQAPEEPYKARRRQAPQVTTFGPSGRTSGTRAAGRPSADSLDPGTLLKGRRTAPTRGWRRFVYKASGGWIRPGEAPDERRRRELAARARTPVATGHHRVAVLSLKGGVGKTTTTVGLGATLAQIRGDRVIAVDANPDRGTLSDKVELETSATVRDLLNERAQIKRYVDIRAFTSQGPSRLEILASDRDPSVSEAFSASDYQAVAQVLENFYSICITDCGTGLLHSAMSGVLGLADQLVLVSSPSVDGARAASATLDWLEAHDHEELVRAATVVLCSVRPRSKSAVDLDRLESHFAARCRSVIRVPYDPHLEEGAEIDLDRLLEPTREAYLRLAAAVGDGFAGPQAMAERRFSEIPDQI
ncbi:MinD/ParA family ATP-binding protein [Microtetraspora fusca]|uniref:MinD/ParA family ATP-binding protein n=1 Tax=Microtetraspora fusca TaxID=1997 RepID=UPI000A43E70C|nr:AAA family ATPase [Microtetraspora fusca]